MSAYTLYIANKNYSSWSLRPWLLMTELKIPFTEKLIPFEESNHANFSAFSPNAKVPCLHDAETVVWDSLAIMEYLAEIHPNVWPQNFQARAWARSASAEMHSGFSALRNHCSMNCGLRLRLHAIPESLLSDLQRIDTLWQEGLNRFGGPFLAGQQFTGVDAFYAPVVFRIQSYNLPLSESALAYCQRILALAGMQQWYAAALREPWRETSHEQDVLSQAECLHDYRVA
jgi:glutathione S-transferase